MGARCVYRLLEAFALPLFRARLRYAGAWLLLVMGMFPTVAHAGAGVGTSGGPYGGNVYALAINPTTPATLYAGTWGGGVFKSTDSGGTWAAANAGLTNQNVNALAINPLTPATLYAGTNGGGIFKSTDSGGNMGRRQRGPDQPVRPLRWPSTPRPPLRSTSATNSGVFKSTDSGGTWGPVNTGLTNLNVTALAINPATPSTLFRRDAQRRGVQIYQLRRYLGPHQCGRITSIWASTPWPSTPQAPPRLYAGTDGPWRVQVH